MAAGDPHIVNATQRAPTFPEALHASHEVIYQMADGSYEGRQIVDAKALLPAVTPQAVSSRASIPSR